jgi:hypothetical protein
LSHDARRIARKATTLVWRGGAGLKKEKSFDSWLLDGRFDRNTAPRKSGFGNSFRDNGDCVQERRKILTQQPIFFSSLVTKRNKNESLEIEAQTSE